MTTKPDINWIPEKDAEEYTDEELDKTPIFLGVKESPSWAFFESNIPSLRTFVRKRIAEMRKNVTSMKLKSPILAVFEALQKEGIPFSQERGLKIYPDGRFKNPAGKGTRNVIDFSKFIGKVLVQEVGERADAGKRGKYKMEIKPAIKGREDVGYSLVLHQPNNAPTLTYPAANPEKPGDNESNSLTGLMKKSLLAQAYAPSAFFKRSLKKLMKEMGLLVLRGEQDSKVKGKKSDKKKTEEAASAEEDEEEDEDDDEEEGGEGEMDLDQLLDEKDDDED